MLTSSVSISRVLLAAALLFATNSADAQDSSTNPYDARSRELTRQTERAGRGPGGHLSLLQLHGLGSSTSRGRTSADLDRLAASRRLSPAVRTYAAVLRALGRIADGDDDRAASDFDDLGFVHRFRVIGPFDNESKAGFGREMPPETNRNQPVDPEVEYEGRERPVRWREYPDITRFGYVNFDAIMRPYVNVCGFAETFVHSDAARPVSVWLGAGGAAKVWWNGELLMSDPAYRGPDPDRSAAVAAARPGWNRLLVKVCVTDADWGFYLRIANPDGTPFGAVRSDPSGAPAAAPAPVRAPRLPAGPISTLAALEARVAADEDDAVASRELSQFLSWTSADDPAVQRARSLAERACELEATADNCLEAAAKAEEWAERQRFLSRAEEAAPRHRRVRLERAAMTVDGFEPERARPLLSSLPVSTIEGFTARLIWVDLLGRYGLHRTALAELERLGRLAPDNLNVLHRRVTAHGRLGRQERVLGLRRLILEREHDNFAVRRRLVGDALARGAEDEALAHVGAMRAIARDDSGTIHYAASVYEGLGRRDEALAAYQAVVDMVPDDATAHVAQGRALLRFEQQHTAVAALRRALELSPQDAETRRLLEQIQPSERPDEAFATPSADILARRRDTGAWPVTILHDLRVASVYDNGLGSTYRQLAAQVHDDEGARRWRSYSIPYEAGSQWVNLRSVTVTRPDGRVLRSYRTRTRNLSDRRYRIYYDRRAFDVILPEVSPGDVVELRYRVDDVSRRNIFDDYFGDLQVLRSATPMQHLEYVLITPSTRALHFNEPRMTGLTRETTEAGGRRVDHYTVANVPALRGEARMPGATEIAPYLHVSTYRNWADVGRWWWGLIQDQLHMDDSLRSTVDDLVRGAPDTRTKVERIFEWVVRNTRYVGLEFGIHGFMPYRVTQVVRRGYGDCKDKASLLYVMLKHAGLDARIALVRTRRNGAIDDLPASLSVFDHAIAYVPELDLYLDGTAENSGTRELPVQDQGVTVLVVGPEDAELRRTPILPSQDAIRERALSIDLAPDGSAVIEGEEIVRGASAAGYRVNYQAEATRDERLQRALGGIFPGLELLHQSFGSLEELEEPVRYTWRARVPRLAEGGGGTLRIAPSSVGELTPTFATRATRRHPLDLGGRSRYVERRVFQMPRGVGATLPAGGTATSAFGTFSLRLVESGGRITATTELAFERDRVSVQDYGEFRSWLEDVDAIIRQRITMGAGR